MWYSGCSETKHGREYRHEEEHVTTSRHGYRVIAGVAALLLLSGWRMGLAEQAVPDDPFRVFVARVEAYARLHQRLERPLPAFGGNADLLSRFLNRGYLASAIRAARSGAKQGDIFTPDIANVFRQRLSAVVPTPETGALVALPGVADAIHVNEPLREETSHSVPPVVLVALPPLPGGIEYRIVGSDLVLWDAHADLVIDVLPAAFLAPSAG